MLRLRAGVYLFFTSCFVIFQAYFEVADQSGTMSLVLWNELCPEFYQRLNVGTVLYVQNYTLKPSYSNRSHPQMDHHRMKTFNSVGMYSLTTQSCILRFSTKVGCESYFCFVFVLFCTNAICGLTLALSYSRNVSVHLSFE